MLSLAEYPGSVPGAYMVTHNYLQFKFQGIPGPRRCTHIQAGRALIHIILKKKKDNLKFQAGLGYVVVANLNSR